MNSAFFKGKFLSSLLLLSIIYFIGQQNAYSQTNPTFTSSPPAPITYGATYDYLIQVTDLEADPTEVIIALGTLPSGVTFIDNGDDTYSISGTPNFAGSTSITLEVRDPVLTSNKNSQIVVIEVEKASQTISFASLSPKTFGDADFVLSATASSALAVGFSIVSGPATLSGNTLSITGAGTVTVAANQSGDVNYNAATQQTQAFTVAKAAQTITFNALTGKTFGDADFVLSATASSALAVGFSIVSG
ncbi:MAG: hypothetical protein ACI9L9_002531, partial [Marivirga sp.]